MKSKIKPKIHIKTENGNSILFSEIKFYEIESVVNDKGEVINEINQNPEIIKFVHAQIINN